MTLPPLERPQPEQDPVHTSKTLAGAAEISPMTHTLRWSPALTSSCPQQSTSKTIGSFPTLPSRASRRRCPPYLMSPTRAKQVTLLPLPGCPAPNRTQSTLEQRRWLHSLTHVRYGCCRSQGQRRNTPGLAEYKQP